MIESYNLQLKAKKQNKNKPIILLFIFIVSILTITLCSKSSPLYPFNDWVDSNCFFTVGKSIVNGQVLYRDIFEQKGPILYFLHSIAYLISPTSFLGVYFLEIVSCFFFLFFSYKIIRLFCDEKSIILIPIISALVYSSQPFSHGDSAEELCLPLLAYAFFIGIKMVITDKKIKLTDCFCIGLSVGTILWIKYTMLGFYIGLIIVPTIIYVKNHWIKDIFKSALMIIAGVINISIPVLLYFIINNSVPELFTVYFYDNIFLYSSINSDNNVILKYIHVILSIGRHFFPVALFILFGFIFCIVKKNIRLFLLYTIILITTFIFTYIGRYFLYYALTFAVFTPLGASGIYIFIRTTILKLFSKRKIIMKSYIINTLYSLVALLAIPLMFKLSPNTYLLSYSKEDMPQYKFDKIISQKENPTLLNYGFLDGGFYTVSNIVPSCKYFCQLNMPYDYMYKTQKYYVDNGLTDFVVTRDTEIKSPYYELSAKCDFYFEGDVRKYYLYSKCK
ncbi:hypothetical protein [Ruminococcus sp.]|uniref:hypothetical protein n=1 Tax=Ruminococcus sp. TaxID=41978 RepID=UPI003F105B67